MLDFRLAEFRLRVFERTQRIVGAQLLAQGEYPYFVDLNGCGGSLIAPSIVLTAAHCGYFDGMKVIVGDFKRRKVKFGAKKTRFLPWRYIPTLIASQIWLVVMGLGLKQEWVNKLSPNLYGVTVQAIDTATCNDRSMYDGEIDDDTIFCAGVQNGGKDSCQGDSGGGSLLGAVVTPYTKFDTTKYRDHASTRLISIYSHRIDGTPRS